MKDYPWLNEYLLAKPGAVKDYKAEWDWHRYSIGGKMFAFLTCPAEKYNPMYACKDIVSLKSDPMMSELLRANYPGDIMPGFYCGKLTWNSVDLGGNVPENTIKQMVDDSYRLIFEKLTRKLQKEILEGAK